MAISIVQAQSEEQWREARRLIEQYAASLDLDLAFQNLQHELAHLAGEYSPPAGAFLLAADQERYLGCVGLRQFASGVGEIKRLYALPVARGQHIGRQLAEAIVEIARQRGYARLLLDTLPSMKQAQSLYASMGFNPTAAYRFNPVPGTVYLELTL
jgi:GNAT superfamily N-acetyltransferase